VLNETAPQRNETAPHGCLVETFTFDLILIGGRGIVVDYLYAKFGDFSSSLLLVL